MTDYSSDDKPTTMLNFFDKSDEWFEKKEKEEKAEKDDDTYVFLSGTQVLAKAFPEESYFVRPLVPKDGITCLGGAPGTMKSYFSTYLALSIIQGTQVLDRFKTDTTNILFIDKENKLKRIQERLSRLGITEEAAQHVFYLTNNFDVTDPSDLAAVVAFIKDHNIGLTFIDTLVRVHQLDENSASDMNKVFVSLKEMLMAGSGVCFLHHFNRRAAFGQTVDVRDQLRGSGDILAMVDSYVSLTWKEKYLEVEQAKSRDDIVTPRFLMQPVFEEKKTYFDFIKEVEDDDRIGTIMVGDKFLSMLQGTSVTRQFVLESLVDGAVSKAAVERAIKQLKQEGKIITYRNGTGDYMYALSKQEKID